MKARLVALAVTGTTTALACSAPPAEDPQVTITADMLVVSDPGRPVTGATLLLGTKELATTDTTGHAPLVLRGLDGDRAQVVVRCPAGFAPPPPVPVTVRRLSAGSGAPRFEARCAPTSRKVVVGIRADGGPHLPVLHLGREVARTDAAGAAHVVLTTKPDEQVALVLDTREQKRLRPASPTLAFVAKDRDDLVLLDQKFDLEKPPPPARRAPAPSGPTRL